MITTAMFKSIVVLSVYRLKSSDFRIYLRFLYQDIRNRSQPEYLSFFRASFSQETGQTDLDETLHRCYIET